MSKTLWIFSIIIIAAFILCANGCKKEKEIIPAEVITVTDIDGNVYRTLTVGKQVWMAENLNVTKYRNGDLIGTTTPDTLDITNQSEPKYQWPCTGNEDSVAVYGRLYTWYALTDPRNVCPNGWHLPSDAEWTTMEEYLIANGYNYDGTSSGDKTAKAMAAAHNWIPTTEVGSVGNPDFPSYRNKSGFSALPGGYRTTEGAFLNIGISNDWWCSTDSTATHAWFRNVYNSYVDVYRDIYSKNTAFSVRCIKDE